MPFLLMVILTLACLPDLEIWPQPLLDAPFGLDGVTWSVLLTALAVGAAVAHARWTARRVARSLDRDPGLRDRLLPAYERRRYVQQLLLFGVLALSLLAFGWGWAVTRFWSANGIVLPGAELLVVAPFLTGMALSWLCYYDADRAAHQAAHRLFDLNPLARAFLDPREVPAAALQAPDAARAFGGRWTYLLFQMRQKLALVMIPVGLLLVQKEFQRRLGGFWGEWQLEVNLAGSACALLAFAAMPWAVRLALGLRPVPDGPLRRRLLAAARRLRFRCSNFLLWDTRGGMANAMVVGLLPWPRYVVFTDRLLEEFSAEEVEAVLGHEVGHVKHFHMLFYLAFLSASMAVLGILSHELSRRLFGAEQQYLEIVPLALAVVVYIFLVFGFLSRRCERQADVYGCRAVSCGAGDCPGHDGDELRAPPDVALCPTGIRTFVRALEKVALVNGISRERPGFFQSWQHSTIARRVAFLQRLIREPALERKFQRRVALVKWGLAAVLGATLAALLLQLAL